MRFRMFLCDDDGGEVGDDDEHWFKMTRSTDPPVFFPWAMIYLVVHPTKKRL